VATSLGHRGCIGINIYMNNGTSLLGRVIRNTRSEHGSPSLRLQVSNVHEPDFLFPQILQLIFGHPDRRGMVTCFDQMLFLGLVTTRTTRTGACRLSLGVQS